ncbi:universal stress protein [Hymenobacter sp. NST-14]|uniref:universal stress protein n=1 Tax=Hymenobacter piscis TaxID=2839984 RepID=UPI001C00B662|nr:universal stress protein [Hymenobacter piscis]MBT9395012.1 universal stress protein [Hymenobacter piscis]
MKNLLVLTDFSSESRYAFDGALQLARRAGGRVVVLHVLDLPETANFSTYGGPVSGELPNGGGGLDDVFVLRLLRVIKQRMHRLLDDAAGKAPNVLVTDRVSTKSLSEAVAETVEQDDIDLIVMGAQGHTPLEHFLLGSNTERMVRTAPRPVLAIKHPVGALAVQRIVMPADFVAEAPTAGADSLRALGQLYPEAAVHLLQVVKPGADKERARLAMADFARHHQLPRAHPVVVHAASPAAGIAAYADRADADLLLLPTHGRTGLSRWLQASIAERVATHAFPPVLTVRL